MKNKPLITTLVLSLLLAGATLSGCRTMEGAGDDLERAGENIEDAAEDAVD